MNLHAGMIKLRLIKFGKIATLHSCDQQQFTIMSSHTGE